MDVDDFFYFVDIPRTASTSLRTALGLDGSRHMHVHAVERRRRVGRWLWDLAWTFSVVRNPYSKVCSQYLNRRHYHEGDLTKNDFTEWVHWRYVEENRDGDLSTNYWSWMWEPQTWWVCDEDEVIVDEVFRFETVGQAWATIRAQVPKRGLSEDLPHENSTEADIETKKLYTPKAKAAVLDYFANDFVRFGYDPKVIPE